MSIINKKNSKITTRLRKSVYGIGYIGIGVYKVAVNKKPTREYKAWYNIMRLSYGPEADGLLSICNEWHNFQCFAEWFDRNNIENCIDRTWVLSRYARCVNNTIYSPKNCVYVPRALAQSRVRETSLTDKKDHIPGVRFSKRKGGYVAFAKLSDKPIVGSGCHRTPELAREEFKLIVCEHMLTILESNKHLMSTSTYDTVEQWYTQL